MESLAVTYKRAHELVLKGYQEEPEDRWKAFAVAAYQSGEKGHVSVMCEYVKDVEAKVDELLKDVPVDNSPSPNKKQIEVTTVVKPTTPR